MTSYVIELGVESGEGKFRQWDSSGFYAGYTDKGPVTVPSVHEAMRLPAKLRCERIVAGDERLKRSRILPVDMTATVE